MMPPKFLDDKSALVIPFILKRIQQHRAKSSLPFFIGLNGVQGAGKTTLVTALLDQLRKPPYSLQPLAFSIDDLYLPHAQLEPLAATNPGNPLLQQRGQPGTHDVALGSDIFAALKSRRPSIAIPFYDKSAFAGKGDRANQSTWLVVNKPDEQPIDVVLFEGWCVGFRPLSDDLLQNKWANAHDALDRESANTADSKKVKGRLGRQELEHLQTVNESLKSYNTLTDQLDAFVHLDAEHIEYVYEWRLEQEAGLRETKGSGMTDAQVIEFVNGYYPSYELYLDRLREGVLTSQIGGQLRVVISRDRSVQSHSIV